MRRGQEKEVAEDSAGFGIEIQGNLTQFSRDGDLGRRECGAPCKHTYIHTYFFKNVF
jgi:hypothetical protein